MGIAKSLTNVTGFRGEKIVELCLTDYSSFTAPLFQPGFLGDKWPSIDFYVELNGVKDRRPYFFVQTKTTAAKLLRESISVNVKKSAVTRLLAVPGPTYIFGVHEPSKRGFVKSVHNGVVLKGVATISLSNELTPTNLQKLYDEVRSFWNRSGQKPSTSVFK